MQKEKIKQALKKWITDHPDGRINDFEMSYIPFINGVRQKMPLFTSSMFYNDIVDWLDEMDAKGAVWILVNDDTIEENDPETVIQGGTRYTKGTPKKKSKDWTLQYKWRKKTDFHTYPSRNTKSSWDEVDGLWITADWKSRFVSKTAAENSLIQGAKERFLSDYYKGRDWRIINQKTKEEYHVSIDRYFTKD